MDAIKFATKFTGLVVGNEAMMGIRIVLMRKIETYLIVMTGQTSSWITAETDEGMLCSNALKCASVGFSPRTNINPPINTLTYV
jgi:hypothetical protein